MRQFIKTIVPTEGYAEIKKIGNKYVVHLEGVAGEDGITTCYECMTDSEPDLTALTSELQEWKNERAARSLELAKSQKTKELMAYDNSSAVNEFFFSGVSMWLDKATRAGLLLRLDAEQKAGLENTTLWFGTHGFTLPVAMAFQILYALEIYASQCYDNTASHAAAIEQLTAKEDVEAYDFTTGYPEKLVLGAQP